MLFFRFLIYKEAEKSKKQKMKQVYLQFVQLAEPFLYHFDYPLIDMAELMKGFFIETVRLFAHFKKEVKEDKDSGFATKIPVRNVLR